MPEPVNPQTLTAARQAAQQAGIRVDGLDHAVADLGDLSRYQTPNGLDLVGLSADMGVIARHRTDLQLAPVAEQMAAQIADQMARLGLRTLPPRPAPLPPLPPLPPLEVSGLPPVDPAAARCTAEHMVAALNRETGGRSPVRVRSHPDDAA